MCVMRASVCDDGDDVDGRGGGDGGGVLAAMSDGVLMLRCGLFGFKSHTAQHSSSQHDANPSSCTRGFNQNIWFRSNPGV